MAAIPASPTELLGAAATPASGSGGPAATCPRDPTPPKPPPLAATKVAATSSTTGAISDMPVARAAWRLQSRTSPMWSW